MQHIAYNTTTSYAQSTAGNAKPGWLKPVAAESYKQPRCVYWTVLMWLRGVRGSSKVCANMTADSVCMCVGARQPLRQPLSHLLASAAWWKVHIYVLVCARVCVCMRKCVARYRAYYDYFLMLALLLPLSTSRKKSPWRREVMISTYASSSRHFISPIFATFRALA